MHYILNYQNFFGLCLAFAVLISCNPSQKKYSSLPEPGMFRVAILYPDGEGKTFDMDYYQKKHMPMVAGFLGENLNHFEIDSGIGRTTNDKAPFIAIGYFYISDTAAYNKAIAANRDVIISDFKNYTNIQPVVQINEIKTINYSDKN